MMFKTLMTGAALAAAMVVAAPSLAQEITMRTVEPERLLVIETTKGTVYVEMNPDIAPGHVERIRLLAGEGFYDGAKWHRVIDGFMAQTGDPTGTGEGSSSYPDLKAELTFRRIPYSTFTSVASPMGLQIGLMDVVPVVSQPDHLGAKREDGSVTAWGTYCPGVAGMARDENENSANSQFFIMRDAYPSLDKRYTIWGRVVVGQEVVNSLKSSSLASGMVDEPDVMIRVRAADQIPHARRPEVQVRDTRSADFIETVRTVRQARGADFSVCDIPLAAEVVKPLG